MGIRSRLKGISEGILSPVIDLLKFLRIPPNAVTITGLLINILAAWYIVKGRFVLAGVIIIIAGIFDMLDGAVARKLNKKTKFGGFLDSVTDRFSEGILYLGILIFYINLNFKNEIILVYTVMFLSFMISYLRARASGLKIDCETGIFTRTERIVVLILGLLLKQLYWAMVIIAFFSAVTVIQRFILTAREASKLDAQPEKKASGKKPKKRK